MLPVILTLLLGQTPPAPAQAAKPSPKPSAPTALAPLSFCSERFKFHWDQLLPLNVNLDGLKVNSIFFNRRAIKSGFLKGAEFGTRAQVEVTNTATKSRNPGFAVAVFDADGKLLGVASGGTKLGTVKPDSTETFDLNFHQVFERLPRGETFVLSIELAD